MLESVFFGQLAWTLFTWGLLILAIYLAFKYALKIYRGGTSNEEVLTTIKANRFHLAMIVVVLGSTILVTALEPLVRPRNTLDNPAQPAREYREDRLKEFIPEIKEPKVDTEAAIQESRADREQTLEDIKEQFKSLPDAP